MKPVLIGAVAGVVGTLMMDVLNAVGARTGIITRIDHRMIGRVSCGWVRGRFLYAHPGDVQNVANELIYGYAAHYLIGIVLASAYVVGWHLLIGGPTSLVWAVAYGVATTVAAYFFLLPSIGLGVCGRRSPHGIKLPLSSLINHLFYGLGIAAGIALV
jgi:hypothetical protein